MVQKPHLKGVITSFMTLQPIKELGQGTASFSFGTYLGCEIVIKITYY